MKSLIYISIAIVAFFVAVFLCFSMYLRTRLFVNLHCAHPVQKKAILKYESYHGSCCWMVGNRTDCWERWDVPCGKAEGISPGYETTFTVMDYTCDGSPTDFKIPVDF